MMPVHWFGARLSGRLRNWTKAGFRWKSVTDSNLSQMNRCFWSGKSAGDQRVDALGAVDFRAVAAAGIDMGDYLGPVLAIGI